MKNELLPCPFCGGKPTMRDQSTAYHPADRYYWVQCTACQTVSDNYRTFDGAVSAWNRRTQTTTPQLERVPDGMYLDGSILVDGNGTRFWCEEMMESTLIWPAGVALYMPAGTVLEQVDADDEDLRRLHEAEDDMLAGNR